MSASKPPNAYLAFDLGASSSRAILGTLEGDRLRMEDLHRFPTPLVERETHLFWDLDALWAELQTGLTRALREAPHLRSLSVDSWGVDYVPLGPEGAPLRDAYAYRDARTAGRMAEAFEQVPAAEIYGATGIQFMEINSLYQLLADLEEEPALFRQTHTRLLIADYLNHRLGGAARSEISLASTTQLLDVRRRDWGTALLRRFGLPAETFAPVVAPGTDIGGVPGTAIRVVAGLSHDTACAVSATPAVDGTNWAYLSCGTWSLLGVELPEPLVTPEAHRAGFTNEAGLDASIRLLKNLNGLWVLQECEREWEAEGQVYTYDALLAEAEQATAPERMVDLNERRFGARGGMQEKLRAYCRERAWPVPETRGQIVRLILESMTESYGRTLRVLEALLGTRIDTIHVLGGGSRNRLLCQYTADACGCTIVAGPVEATALGNLLVQARTLGDLPEGLSIREVVRRSTDLQPYRPRREAGSRTP